ncbi:MAG: 50S ribosomal protein L7/L12 [Candidatus Peregrinibacteria bacterium GW2011_GWA2_47_7]|nr:MAG: 50S ribosomal protein L7/L12 [Candidatus Peregrinibacteria bacterium GW2011_GWA2_47_7]
MALASKLALLKEMIDSAEASLRSAKQILIELTGGENFQSKYKKVAENISVTDDGEDGGAQVIEGVFDGQKMIAQNSKTYPVPSNYASKSKLVPGDVLKLTVKEDGTFVYKQIGPVERKRVIGPLIHEEGQYRILANGKAYKVLLASVTYFRAEVGDRITLIIPALEESEWGAIENVLPKDE